MPLKVPPELVANTASNTVIVPAQEAFQVDGRPASASVHRWIEAYQGECLPPDASDVDCGGGKGDGPVFAHTKNIRVVGPDEYRLDADNDGLGCEE